MVDLSLNAESHQLVAVATPAQHEILASAIRRLQRDPIEVEVFPLQNADPFSIEMAIGQLYASETDKPVANGDSETQQLFVRGTRKQIDEVRQLLEKMGELPTDTGVPERGTRIVPMRGDLETAIQQLQQVWPKLRSNPLHVVAPAESSIQNIVTPAETPTTTSPNDASRDVPERDATDSSNDVREREAMEKHKIETPSGGTPSGDAPSGDRDQPDDGASAANTAAQPVGESRLPTMPSQESTSKTELPAAPVVIFPKSGAITLLSDDEAALNQAEALLRTLARQNLVDAGAGNFAVYSLRNAGARSVAKLLTELFEQMPLTARTTVGRVSMVADDRLNAVVVHGRAADRNVIAELLQVLDSANVPDSLANARPRIVPVEYMEADRVLTILRGVYESQLEAGGNRPEIEIPRGISEEVATLLQQINASSSGPLLTLEIDDVTNSIVVLAPPQLSTEVSALIQTLDTNAKQNDARDVGIVTLKGTNVKQLKPAIDELLRPTRRRRN